MLILKIGVGLGWKSSQPCVVGRHYCVLYVGPRPWALLRTVDCSGQPWSLPAGSSAAWQIKLIMRAPCDVSFLIAAASFLQPRQPKATTHQHRTFERTFGKHPASLRRATPDHLNIPTRLVSNALAGSRHKYSR